MTQRIQPKAPEPKQTPKQASVEVKDPKPDAPATNKLTRKTVGQRQEKDVNANNNGKASVDVPMKVPSKLKLLRRLQFRILYTSSLLNINI
jgi:hypothetical protein